MPRRKKQVEIPEEQEDYFGSIEYGMDDYNDPLDDLTAEEINQLANYIDMIQGRRGAVSDDSDDNSDESPSNSLYPLEDNNDDDDEE